MNKLMDKVKDMAIINPLPGKQTALTPQQERIIGLTEEEEAQVVEEVDDAAEEFCNDCGAQIIGYHVCPGVPGTNND